MRTKTAFRTGDPHWTFTLMLRIPVFLLAGVLQTRGHAADRDPVATPGRFERRIAKEPKYASSPKYALMALGTDAKTWVWMVEDGKTLYIDKNANGDLTDDGPPIEPTNVRDLGRYESVLDEIAPIDGSRHSNFCLRRWNYGGKKEYGLSLTVDGRLPMYAGWFGTFWAASPDEVPILHFGGPFEPHMLRRKEFVIGSGFDRLSMGFMHSGEKDDADTRLSIEALRKTVVPTLRIDWPVADDAPAFQTSYPLHDRCCYWEFYEPNFKMPDGVVAGEATVSLSFEGGDFPSDLVTTQIKVPVVAKKPAE